MAEMYKKFVRKNARGVGLAENILEYMALFVPSKFGDTDLIREAIYSFVHIVRMYHNQIIRPMRNIKAVPVLLSVISNLEVTLEMLSYKNGGKSNKWTSIVFIEAIKTLLRLWFYLRGKDGVLVGDGDWKHSGRSPTEDSASEIPKKSWKGQRTGKFIPILKGAEDHISTSNAISKNENSLARIIQNLGEVFHILRPFVFVVLRIKFGRESWIPWIISLCFDFFSLFASIYATNHSQDRPMLFEEISRRKTLLLFYLIRTPFFDWTVLPILQKASFAVKSIPLLGTIVEYAVNLVLYYQKYHFYISAS